MSIVLSYDWMKWVAIAAAVISVFEWTLINIESSHFSERADARGTLGGPVNG